VAALTFNRDTDPWPVGEPFLRHEDMHRVYERCACPLRNNGAAYCWGDNSHEYVSFFNACRVVATSFLHRRIVEKFACDKP